MSVLPRSLTEPLGKEAELQRRLPSGKVQCTACARLCQIGEGQIGLCGIRGVVHGKLHLLAYGKIIAGNIDPIEKKPVVHYRPGSKIFSVATSGCNWLCHPKGARILMSDGKTKPIEEILAGDLLWSYQPQNDMKIVPNVVTHVGTRLAKLWEIRYGSGGKGRLVLTEEHPVFTASGWKPAAAIGEGEQILKVWYQNTEKWKQNRASAISRASFGCLSCGDSIIGLEEWNRHRGGCYTRGMEKPPELRRAYSQRMKENNPMKDPEVAKRALTSSRERFLVDPNHGWHRNKRLLRTWLHRHPSAGQLELYKIINEIGVQYEKEFEIVPEVKIAGSKRSYFADAAFPDMKLDVEVDGWWHYHNERVKSDDKVRDETLSANGWNVMRISGSHLFNHPEEVKALLSERLSQKVMVNKRAWLEVKSAKPTERVEQVYSIESVPDHNYVADGILVHNCNYCQNYDISQRRKIEGVNATPEDVARMASSYGCEGLAYTYNQPTIFIEYAKDIGLLAHKAGIFNIFVSNGYDTPESVGMMKEFLDCITVDFKGSGETSFVRRYIGIPNAEPIFQTLLDIKQRTSIHTEITDLIVPGVGDSLEEARKLARWTYDNLGPDMPIHFLRFHPDYKMRDIPSTPVLTLEKHYEVAREEGLRYVYIGNVPGHPAESTYCPGCGKVLIKRHGYEIPEYNLDDNNRCRFCAYQTPIVGPLSKSVADDRFIPVLY